MGCHYLGAEKVDRDRSLARADQQAFRIEFSSVHIDEDGLEAALAQRPSVMAFAWPQPEQDVKSYIDRAHAAGSKVTYMASGVPDAVKAAKAGADVIIAQGTEGGGHVGWVTTLALVPMVVDAVAPVRCLRPAEFDGRGLRARTTGYCSVRNSSATDKSPLHPNFKKKSSSATATIRCSRKFPISPPERSGPARCRITAR